ncbi:MAG: hypothetical protein M0Z43_02245, partial [Acidithiobacillus sp.]|nr:hypothetical protein [Acidithiobacillus sp.]
MLADKDLQIRYEQNQQLARRFSESWQESLAGFRRVKNFIQQYQQHPMSGVPARARSFRLE